MTLFDEFSKAAEEAAIDLEMDKDKIETRHLETPRMGLDYDASLYEGTIGFNFHLSTVTEEEDPTSGEMEASFFFDFEEAVATYAFRENLNYMKGQPNFLSKWISWAIFNFRLAHEKANWESLFHDTTLRIYGTPGYCDPAEAEAVLLFHAVLAIHRGKVIVVRFRHIHKDPWIFRNFSYAIYVSPRGFPGFWVIFPDNCGLDSGRAHQTYRRFESLIEMVRQKFPVQIKRYDVPYDELERFLLKNADGFYSIFRDSQLMPFYRYWGPSKVLEGSEKQFNSFIEKLQKENYSEALRDLRALVQQAQENVIKLKNLDATEIQSPDINKLGSFLIRKHQLDGRLNPWFTAFTSIANLASHRSFPTGKDLQDSTIRTRVLVTFHLGIQLLEELDDIVNQRISLRDLLESPDDS